MSTINIYDLCFSYDGGDELFSHVSLQLETRWKLGLIGRNGRGKTTLLRILLGELEYEGKIDSPVSMQYFPFKIEDQSKTTREIAESIAQFEPWELERELSLLDVSDDVLDRPFETLSGGERTKILLGSLFLNEDNFLLLDEPTNHLDIEARRIVGNYLGKKSGFILVSHDRTLLDSCIDHVLSINRANIELIKGNYSNWNSGVESKKRHEESRNQKLRKDIGHLKDSAQCSAKWSNQAEKEKYGNGPVDRGFIGSKAEKMMKRAKSAETRKLKAIEEKSQLFKNSETEDRLSITPLKFHTSRLLELSGITIAYGEKTVIENFNFSIEMGERIALCGRNGCGKSSLLKLIAGRELAEEIPFSGRRIVPSKLKISYVPQDASFLRGKMCDFIEKRQLNETLFKTILRKLGFKREDFETDFASYSAGQQKKITLAASLSEPAHLYIWDEPLNYIDVISRIQIENLLQEFRPSIIFVEHDAKFLENVSTKRIILQHE